eukprot:1579453-Ditylum_brightwellii.AAC.1
MDMNPGEVRDGKAPLESRTSDTLPRMDKNPGEATYEDSIPDLMQKKNCADDEESDAESDDDDEDIEESLSPDMKDYHFKDGILILKARYCSQLSDSKDVWETPINILKKDAPLEVARYIQNNVTE